MKNAIALRPSYWASVSGGKDSLYMLKIILSNLDKYPLDGVVHFELEIDYPFIKNVIDYMEEECKRYGIRFVRIRPRKTWQELYKKYGFPSRTRRWCNSEYKLDAKRQLCNFMKGLGYSVITYIGYCKDEITRYSKRSVLFERYPLVEEGVNEDTILEWARDVPLFNDFYKYNRRCGCMYCPLSSYTTLAYICKYYPESYESMIKMMKDTEIKDALKYKDKGYSKPFTIRGPGITAEYVDWIVKKKYLPKLEKGRMRAKKLIDM